MNFAPMVFNVGGIRVTSPDDMSTQVMGINQQFDQFLSYKRNYGFGEDNGDLNQVNFPYSIVIDNDATDSNSQKTSFL